MTAKLPDSDLPSSGADRSATGPGAETSLADEAVLSALGLLEASERRLVGFFIKKPQTKI
ncbi:MAG: hypothetical protein ACO3P9_11650 [Phycisphaerales bacterium]